MNDILSKERIFNQLIDKFCGALTKEEEISAWFKKADFKAEPGYKYTFTASAQQNCTSITGGVKNAHPYTLIYTWIVANTDTETIMKWYLEKTEKRRD